MDAASNRTQMVDLAGTNTYQYDDLYRLTQVTYPTPQADTYTYDSVGNRLTKNSTSYNYDDAGQMTAAGGVTYGYDNNGNQTSRGSDTFTYDHENRLTQSVIGGVTSSSVYNGDGLRMSHTVSGQTTSYTWDVAAGLPVVLQDGTNTYLYGLDLISATDGAGVQTYFLYDGLGSTTDLTDGSGNVVDGYTYDVFGGIRSQSGASANYWLFTGEQRDSDSSLYFLRARYYDPAIGRFLGQDPASAGHPYGYAGNNPVNFVDPSGLCHERLGYDQVCRLVHQFSKSEDKERGFKPTTQDFRGEWDVIVGKLGSGRPHERVKISLWARVTLSGSGSEVYFTVSREGSGIDVLYGAVSYQNAQSRRANLTQCIGACLTSPGNIGSGTAAAGRESGQPERVELKLSRSLDRDVGTFMSSDTLTLDLQSGRTSKNTCIPWAAAYLNRNACR